ncbi:protein translocase subunit SecDF [Mycoplasmopsis iners]|uniref:protein translocase subunit SecDF n=1 Tax=Mycoplasmopsis iners TaxID=76630 RepID=UPI000B2B74D1
MTLISSICAIVFGSLFYVSKNVNKSVEYGGGVEFLVQVKNQTGDETDEFTKNVADSIDKRLTGGVSFNGTKVETQGEGKILITRNGSLTDDERKRFEKTITDKPNLILTDINMVPLFVDNQFNSNHDAIDYKNITRYIPPLKPNGASLDYQQNGSASYAIKVDLVDKAAEVQWTEATDYVSSTTRTILMWLDLDKLVDMAETMYPDKWEKAGKNPYNFVYVDETPYDTTNKQANTLKVYQFDAKNFLVSNAGVSQALTGSSFTISGRFTEEEAKKLTESINFGTAKYDLTFLSSNYVDASSVSGSFDKALLAGVVVFSLISVFMIVNYGLLGALSTISIALYMFLTLLMFTVLRGEYSPVTIAALIIGIGISVDANIITFERLKSEVYAGEKIKKAIKNSNRMSMSSIIDANLTTLIVSFILFYFGTSAVKGFSLSLVFSVIFTLLVMLVFTKSISSLIVGTGYFDKRLWLLGIRYRKINNLNAQIFYRKFDYVKNSKWFALGSLIFVVIALIVFSSIAGVQKEFWAGFNRSLEFQGGINISIEGKNNNIIDIVQAEQIKAFLISKQAELGINNVSEFVKILPVNSDRTIFKVVIETPQDLNNSMDNIKNIINENIASVQVWNYGISSIEAQNLVKNALLAVSISFVGIIVYTLIRLKWTFSFAAIIGLLHDVILTIGFIIVTRLQLSPIIVAAILSIIAFSINDTIVVFDRIREKINSNYYHEFLTYQQIKQIANSSIADTIKRSIYTSLTTILAVLVLLMFKDATNLAFNLVMIFGLAIGAYSSIFICAWIWVKLETIRQLGIKKRQDKKYWVMPGPEEQIFPGINDFIA